MPHAPEFYSINEAKKPVANRVYHDDSACGPGREIPQHERRPGRGPSGEAAYRLCEDCQEEHKKGH